MLEVNILRKVLDYSITENLRTKFKKALFYHSKGFSSDCAFGTLITQII